MDSDASRLAATVLSAVPVFVVTGGTRGIGLAVCRGIVAASPSALLIFTGRDAAAGAIAEAELRQLGGVNATYVESDMCDDACADAVLAKLPPGVAIAGLVNNAAMNTKDPTQVYAMLRANVGGPRTLTAALLPHMAYGARVVNVTNNNAVTSLATGEAAALLRACGSQGADARGQGGDGGGQGGDDNGGRGKRKRKSGLMAADRKKLGGAEADDAHADRFEAERGWEALDAAMAHCTTSLGLADPAARASSGWPEKGGYTCPKQLLAALTRVQRVNAFFAERGVVVTACDPGWTQTAMTAGKPAPLTPAQGADTVLWLLLEMEAEEAESGIYYKRKCHGWHAAYR